MQRESFVFYRSFFEAVKRQPKKVQAAIYNAIADYALNGTEPEDNDAVMSIFVLVKPQIDANNTRYENGMKGARHGAKGGRPENENPKETPKGKNKNPKETPKPENGNPEETPKPENENPKETPNVNVNDNVNVNVNENVNDNDNGNEKEQAAEPPDTRARTREGQSPSGRYCPEDPKLNQTVEDFIAFRKGIKAPMSGKAVELMLKKLDGMTRDNDEKIAILEQSIVNGWKGIFPLSPEQKAGGNPFVEYLRESESADPFFEEG